MSSVPGYLGSIMLVLCATSAANSVAAQTGPVLLERDALLAPAQNQVDARFGHSVALDGDRMLVGAPRWDADPARSGAAFVFERTADGWE